MYSNTTINDNFNRVFSILNNIRQTQNMILDTLYDSNQTNVRPLVPQPPRSDLFNTMNSFNRPPMNSFNRPPMNSFNRPPMNSFNRPPSLNPPTQPPTTFTDRATNVEISFVDPRTPENAMLTGIFNNLFGPQNETTPPELTFTEILNNTEIDLNTTLVGEMCTICRANMEENTIIKKIKKCNHCFHQNCLDNWLKNHTTCPNCRQDIRQNETDEELEPDTTGASTEESTEQSTVDL
jgi:hypothetical protein